MTINDVTALEDWFANTELPKAPVMLFPGTTIADLDKFLEVHFAALKANPDSKANVPVWYRLKSFKLLIESNL
jgi:hypothetical protein